MQQLKLLTARKSPKQKNSKQSNSMSWDKLPEGARLEAIHSIAKMLIEHLNKNQKSEANDE